MTQIIASEAITARIYFIRGTRVMLDRDLAELYGVETKSLKQAVRRNMERFPPDFMFELSKEESDSLRSQIVTLKRGQHASAAGQGRVIQRVETPPRKAGQPPGSESLEADW